MVSGIGCFFQASRASTTHINDVDVKESQRDEELVDPLDIDGILPVNVGGIIVNI